MQIQRYLDNEMSSSERADFEALLAAEPDKQKEFETQQAARALVFRVQQAAIKTQLQEGPPPTNKSWWWSLLALFIALGLFLGFTYYRQTDARLLDQPMSSFCEQTKDEFRGADMPLQRDPETQSLCDLYASEEYEKLKTVLNERLENLPNTDPLRMKYTYPLAIAYAKLGDIQKAKELLLAIETYGYDYQPKAKETLDGLNSFWR